MTYFAERIKKLNLSYIFIQPAAIAFYLWVVLIFFLPDIFSKFQLELIKTNQLPENSIVQYIDLNCDGITEEVRAGYNTGLKYPNLLIWDENHKVINQWNLRGKHIIARKILHGDFDNDQFEELFAFTSVADSLFLNCVELLDPDGINIKNRFICKTGVFDIDNADPKLTDGKLIDVNGDNMDELVFTIYAGFSGFPRKTYCYFIDEDSLIHSPPSAAGITYVNFMDINDDGIEEITGRVTAHENIHYPAPYSDSSAWLMVFNPAAGLNFHFNPVKFDAGIGSFVSPEVIELAGKKYIAAVFMNQSSEVNPGYFLLNLFDTYGNLIKRKRINFEDHEDLSFVNLTEHPENKHFHLMDLHGNVYISDQNLNLKLKREFSADLAISIASKMEKDIDADNKKEFLFIDSSVGYSLVIYRSDLTEPVTIELPYAEDVQNWNASVIKKTASEEPLLFIQAGNKAYNLKYTRNNLYYLKYPFYAGLYLLIFLMLWLLQKAQNKIAKRKFETERLILKQQLAISKNQIEPHFMLNTLNNIGYLFMKEERAKAQYYFGKFASLINRNLQYADQVVTSLDEELKFIEDYLVLQKYRLGEDFSFEFEIEEKLDTSAIKIPHSLLFTFAENAVKHGLLIKEGEKKLIIRGNHSEGSIRIEIIDNGIGRKHSAEQNTNGSGKGIEIARNIMNSYNKLFNSNISFEIKDMENGDDKVSGTVVYVLI